MRTVLSLVTVLACLLVLPACSDAEKPAETNAEEVITTVELTLTPAGASPFVATWDDTDGDGTPAVDPITLADAGAYTLGVRFLNALEDPAEDITTEVDAESDEHQVFVTGSAVTGPASALSSAFVRHAYADTDANGLPVGLSNTLEALDTGSGEFVVTLQHLPAESGVAVKVAGLAEIVAAEGFSAIPGEPDASVTFPLTIE